MRLLIKLAAGVVLMAAMTPVALAAEPDRGPDLLKRTNGDFLDALDVSKDVDKSLPEVKARSRWLRWLPKGKVRLKRGMIHQQTKVRANVSWQDFQKNLDILDWGSNTALFRGGEVVRHFDTHDKSFGDKWTGFAEMLGKRPDERIMAQTERMDLTGTHVTKDVVYRKTEKRGEARWRVFHTDKNTVWPKIKTTRSDDGRIEFRSIEDGKAVEITIGSRHDLCVGRFGGALVNALAAIPLKVYMTACALKYRRLGKGRGVLGKYGKARIQTGDIRRKGAVQPMGRRF